MFRGSEDVEVKNSLLGASDPSGEDLGLFLMDHLQVPHWLSNECTPSVVEGFYRDNDIVDVVRLNGYAVRTLIRKYEAPRYVDQGWPMSRLPFAGRYGK